MCALTALPSPRRGPEQACAGRSLLGARCPQVLAEASRSPGAASGSPSVSPRWPSRQRAGLSPVLTPHRGTEEPCGPEGRAPSSAMLRGVSGAVGRVPGDSYQCLCQAVSWVRGPAPRCGPDTAPSPRAVISPRGSWDVAGPHLPFTVPGGMMSSLRDRGPQARLPWWGRGPRALNVVRCQGAHVAPVAPAALSPFEGAALLSGRGGRGLRPAPAG